LTTVGDDITVKREVERHLRWRMGTTTANVKAAKDTTRPAREITQIAEHERRKR
jgi:hypothetical protein